MLRAVLLHDLCQLEVHVRFDTSRSVFLVLRLFTDNHSTDGTRCRERLHDRLRLELDRSLHEQWVVDTACSGPRLRTFLVLETEKLQTLHISVEPILA